VYWSITTNAFKLLDIYLSLIRILDFYLSSNSHIL